MTQLTEHFSLEEFTRSSTAEAHGIENTPTDAHLEHLQVLAEAMEEVRKLCMGRVVTVHSAYRNPQVNALVGGVPTSDHATGYACDFSIMGWDDYGVAKRIAASAVKFDQLIYEKGRCVHLSVNPRMRQQVLSQPGGPGSQALAGIVK